MILSKIRAGWRLPMAMMQSVRACQPRLLKVTYHPIQGAVAKRCMHLIPSSQYETPFTDRFRFPVVLKLYWELIPLFVVTVIAVALVPSFWLWSVGHKVDASFCHQYWKTSVSRTMDLRQPTYNKIIIINQRYEPWPEMQDVLDKMKRAQESGIQQAQQCPRVKVC